MLENIIQGNLVIAWVALLGAFAILAKCADVFVENSIALANRLGIPKLVVGIVLVSLATTAPELAVSLMSALGGEPQMALGNAIGSVICDDGLALALCGIMAVGPIAVIPGILRTSGIFLISIEILAFLFIIGDSTLNRWEGGVLVALFVCYLIFLFYQHRKGKLDQEQNAEETAVEAGQGASMIKIVAMFILSLGGIIIASEFIITSAKTIALSFGMPTAVVAAVLVAFGTSIPEVATCITAARKNEGELAVGNIIGADIMNICWVAGASAIANDLELSPEEIWFMFPWMFVIVGVMLFLLWRGHNLNRQKGFILLGLYVVYLVSFFLLF
ncbi:MAG: calcium/sodium antiporter [Kiritimatiellae bacterium]|nr:calcium/sodium antiporter [Kiritimatiellia bacterium]